MTRRRSGASRRWAILASVVVGVACLGLAVADATQLTVASNPLFLQSLSRCTNATIATTGFRFSGTGNWNRVRLVGVPAACAGLPISVFVYRASGQLATGTGTAALGTVSVTTGGYASGNVTGVALFIGGWGVPATWSTGGVSLRSFQNGLYVTSAGTTSPLIADSATAGTNQQFDLITNADASVSLRAHVNTRYVTVDGATSQLYANSTTIGTTQKFTLINNPDGTIALQSISNTFYVCAENAGASPLIANRTAILQWEEFYLVIN